MEVNGMVDTYNTHVQMVQTNVDSFDGICVNISFFNGIWIQFFLRKQESFVSGISVFIVVFSIIICAEELICASSLKIKDSLYDYMSLLFVVSYDHNYLIFLVKPLSFFVAQKSFYLFCTQNYNGMGTWPHCKFLSYSMRTILIILFSPLCFALGFQGIHLQKKNSTLTLQQT